MIVGLALAAAVVGSAGADRAQRLDTALGDLAYTVGACERTLPGQEADAAVLALTGANIDNPSDEQRQHRSLFTSLFLEGRSSSTSGHLSAADCRQMIDELTGALRDAVAETSEL